MTCPANPYIILVYRIPAQPSRHRLQLEYVSALIEESGGSSILFDASAHFPTGDALIQQEFRAAADVRMEEIANRLSALRDKFDQVASPIALEHAEEELKRERIAYLRARRLSYYGSERDGDIEQNITDLRTALDELGRTTK
jgi:hypothetical protein